MPEIETLKKREINPNLIVIDGPSGSGKDTIARIVAQVLTVIGVNAVYLSEESMDHDRNLLIPLTRNPLEFLCQVSQNRQIYVVPKIYALTNEGHLVISTRGEVTTQVYQGIGAKVTPELVHNTHAELDIPLPAHTLILRCDPDVAMTRIHQDMTRPTTRTVLDGQFTSDRQGAEERNTQYEQVQDFYEQHQIPVDSIDTTDLTIWESAIESVQLILQHRGREDLLPHALNLISSLQSVEDSLPEGFESTLKAAVIPILERCRPGFDLPHTLDVVLAMKLLLTQHSELDPKLMLASAYLHDIGYAGLFDETAQYGEILEKKDLHMALGARQAIIELRKLGIMSESEIQIVASMILVHDDVEACTTNHMRVLMEADTLGILTRGLIAPTFTRNALQRWLDKNEYRRVRRFTTPLAIKMAFPLIEGIRKLIPFMPEVEP